VMGLTDPQWDAQFAPAMWPRLKAELTRRFAERPRDAWIAAFAGHEACVAPELGYEDAQANPHTHASQSFTKDDGVTPTAPATRKSVSGTVPPRMAGPSEGGAVLREIGFDEEEIAALGL